jgi:hypothetical protein
MYNPLLDNPSQLKDAELEAKINELGRKYSIACRLGMNQVIPQLLISIEMYRNELSQRSQESLKKVTGKANGNLDDLINIE